MDAWLYKRHLVPWVSDESIIIARAGRGGPIIDAGVDPIELCDRLARKLHNPLPGELDDEQAEAVCTWIAERVFESLDPAEGPLFMHPCCGVRVTYGARRETSVTTDYGSLDTAAEVLDDLLAGGVS